MQNFASSSQDRAKHYAVLGNGNFYLVILQILSFIPIYVLWALPFSYRALDAGLRSIGARTLYEAARVMGASTFTIIVRVIVPNMIGAIIAAMS